MIRAADMLENPVTKERLLFRKTSSAMGVAVLGGGRVGALSEENRVGSLSPSSSDTQATDPSPLARSLSHSTSSVVLPKPAGAEISVSLRPASRSSLAVSFGRA
jgi:hypothetical protein